MLAVIATAYSNGTAVAAIMGRIDANAEICLLIDRISSPDSVHYGAWIALL